MALLAGCGGGSTHTSATATITVSGRATAKASPETASAAGTATATASPRAAPPPRPPTRVVVLNSALGSGPTGFTPAVSWRGETAAWIARSPSGIALLSFNQRLAGLRLHSGTIDAGESGWRWGPAVSHSERHRLVAAVNGGFKLSTGAGGFASYGRVAVPLQAGLGSIVTYVDGGTDVGSWHHGFPRAGRAVASVRQNLTLLIDHGAAVASVGCNSCWGAALGGVSNPARSALGVTGDGRLIWAGGEHVTVEELVAALLDARVARAVELDINPQWVAGYLYQHHRGGTLLPVPVVPGQPGIPGFFLAPYSRDFFTIVAR